MLVVYSDTLNELFKAADSQRKETDVLLESLPIVLMSFNNTWEFTKTPQRRLEEPSSVSINSGQRNFCLDDSWWTLVATRERFSHVTDRTEKYLNNGRSTTTDSWSIKRTRKKRKLKLLHQQSQLSFSIATAFPNIMSSLNLIFATMLEWI